MAWCPKCKNEYREGVKVCTDCGCELIEEEQNGDLEPLTSGDEEKLNLLKKYLEFNKLKGVTLKFDEKEGVYELSVLKEDKEAASAMVRVFMQQEYLREQQSKEMAEAVELAADDGRKFSETEEGTLSQKSASDGMAVVYRNSSERAEDNRSSAWTLLIVGGIGLLVMVFGMMDVIPLRLGNSYMFYGVMCTVFLLFIVMGVVSMRNAKIFAGKAESENTLRDAMTKWYQENLNAAKIEEGLVGEEDVSDEILYFKRVQKMKDMFNHQFMNLDQVFLEHFIDEEVYDYFFSDTEE